MRQGVLYLRSSKDRSDVSIAAQRRELSALAERREITIVGEYADVVESAKSEHRPAFQQLLRDLKAAARPWEALLMVDTSRLSRRRYVAQVFKHEAQRRGVELLYSKVPETDPITTVILESVLEAMDEVHSLMSREKGLGGMAENVRQGYRAGGRAPKGYRLQPVATGAVREGSPVHKTVLVPSDDAPLVARYLKARAGGAPRTLVRRELAITWPLTTLIGLEWRALTYAGHQVWNQTHPQEGGRYVGGRKYRPRADWLIREHAHPALISQDEAERILGQLESSERGAALSRAKRGLSAYLLSGVLTAPDGRRWEGWRDRYRLKRQGDRPGRYVDLAAVDAAVVAQLAADLGRPDTIDALLAAARQSAGAAHDPGRELRRELVALNAQISRAMDLAVQLQDPAPALRKVDELEARRRALADEAQRMRAETEAAHALRAITRPQLQALIAGLLEELRETARPRLKGVIQAIVREIVLDPAEMTLQIHYRLAMPDTLEMASPRGRDGWGIEYAGAVVAAAGAALRR